MSLPLFPHPYSYPLDDDDDDDDDSDGGGSLVDRCVGGSLMLPPLCGGCAVPALASVKRPFFKGSAGKACEFALVMPSQSRGCAVPFFSQIRSQNSVIY